jgi:hypothetical protein
MTLKGMLNRARDRSAWVCVDHVSVVGLFARSCYVIKENVARIAKPTLGHT